MTAVYPRALRAVLAVPLLISALLVVIPAVAANGTITPASKTLPEAAGGWKMALTVKLPKKPDPAYQTFRFFFTPVVLYETFMDDTKPGEQTRALPQDKNTKPSVESLEVGFSDARNQVWDTTKFDFIIKRDRGFESGEYKVEVRDTNDRVIGSSFVVKLDGKNPMVDRRAMVMSGTPRKKEAPKKEDQGPAAAPSDTPTPEAASLPASTTADGPSAPPPPAKKGCSIEAVGAPGGRDTASLGLALAVLAAVGARRRPT